MMMSRRLWKTEKSSIVHRTESVSMMHHGQSVVVSSTAVDQTQQLLLYLASLTRGTARSSCVAERRWHRLSVAGREHTSHLRSCLTRVCLLKASPPTERLHYTTERYERDDELCYFVVVHTAFVRQYAVLHFSRPKQIFRTINKPDVDRRRK